MAAMAASTLNSMTTRDRLPASASANLGSFVYHFGTRDAFVQELIESCSARNYRRHSPTSHATATG
jgi:hypothetical protein